jgi:hypothetical protein
MSTTLAINPMPLSAPNTPPRPYDVNVKDLRLVKETYGQSGEVFKLLVGKISGNSAYVLQAPNGQQMLLKDLQGNLVTDPGEVERIVQMITGGQLTAGPFVAVPLAGHALVLVAAAIGTLSWSYHSATTKQQKEEALNQFGEAIKDVVKKIPEQEGNIYQHIQETLNTWGGQGALLLAWFRGMFGNASNPVAKPPPTQTPRVNKPATSPQTQIPRGNDNNPATSPQTQTPGVVNNPASPQTQIPGVVINPWTTPINPTRRQPTSEELNKNFTNLITQLNEAVQGTIGSHEDFVTLWNRLSQKYGNLAALPVSLRDPLPPGVTLTELLPEMQRKLFDRRLASLQSTLSVEDPNVVRAVQQQLELLEKFVKDRPGLNEGGVSAYALDKIKQLRKEINLRFSPGGTRDQTTAEFNMATVAQQLQSLGAKYPGLKMYLQGILRLPTEERTKALQALLNGGTASAPGMPPLKPDDQKTLGMAIEGLCNALGSAVSDSLQGKPLDQQLQGIGIAFVVGALTADNLQTRIDIFVANALATGGEAYVRQLAGLDPVQDGLNNIFTMLIGGGVALGMHEVAELVRWSLFKLKPELGGEAPNGEGRGGTKHGNDPQPTNQPMATMGQSTNNVPSAPQDEGFKPRKHNPDAIRAVFENWLGKFTKREQFTDKQIGAILALNGYGGFTRVGKTNLHENLKETGYLDLILPIISKQPTIDANLLPRSAWDEMNPTLLNDLITIFNQGAEEIVGHYKKNASSAFGDAFTALYALAQMLNLSPRYVSDDRFKAMGAHQFLDLVRALGEKKGKSWGKEGSLPPTLGAFNDLMKNQGLSEDTRKYLEDLVNSERPANKYSAAGKPPYSYPKNSFDQLGRFVWEHPVTFFVSAGTALGAGAFAIPRAWEGAVQTWNVGKIGENEAFNIDDRNNLEKVTKGPVFRGAVNSVGVAGVLLPLSAEIFASGAIGVLFNLVPSLQEEYSDHLHNRGALIDYNYILDFQQFRQELLKQNPEKAARLNNFLNVFENGDSLDLAKPEVALKFDQMLNGISDGDLGIDREGLNKIVGESLTPQSTNNGPDMLLKRLEKNRTFMDFVMSFLQANGTKVINVELSKLPDEIKVKLGIPLDQSGGHSINCYQLLRAIYETQITPLVNFESSLEYQKLLQKWVEKGWITRTSGEQQFELTDAYNTDAISTMKKEYREAAEIYLKSKIAFDSEVLNELALTAANTSVLLEVIRAMTQGNSDISNVTGTRQPISAAAQTILAKIKEYLDQLVTPFELRLDAMSTNVKSSLSGDQTALVSSADQIYNDGLTTLTSLNGQNVIPDTITPKNQTREEEKLNDLVGRANTEIQKRITSLREILKQLEATQDKNTRQSPPLENAIQKVRDSIADLETKKADLIARINANINSLSVRLQQYEAQELSEKETKIRAFIERRNNWNKEVADNFNGLERNKPSLIHPKGSWLNQQIRINGFVLPPPTKDNLDDQVKKVIADLKAAGAFAPEITGTDRNKNGILHDADSAETAIRDYYKQFEIYRTEEQPTPTQPPPGLRYERPGQ